MGPFAHEGISEMELVGSKDGGGGVTGKPQLYMSKLDVAEKTELRFAQLITFLKIYIII